MRKAQKVSNNEIEEDVVKVECKVCGSTVRGYNPLGDYYAYADIHTTSDSRSTCLGSFQDYLIL